MNGVLIWGSSSHKPCASFAIRRVYGHCLLCQSFVWNASNFPRLSDPNVLDERLFTLRVCPCRQVATGLGTRLAGAGNMNKNVGLLMLITVGAPMSQLALSLTKFPVVFSSRHAYANVAVVPDDAVGFFLAGR